MTSTPKTADLMDAHPSAQACSLQFRSYGGRPAFHGPIRTVRCHEDNALARRTLEQPGAGAVLVIDGGGSLRRALVGDNLAEIAVRNGWTGIVVYGAVRDTAELATIPLGVLALGTHPQRGERTGAGGVDVSVSFGGVEFRPGAWLCADHDGIVVLPSAPPA